VLKSGPEVEPLENEWEELRSSCGGSIFTSHAFTQAWIRYFADRASPRVITAREDGQLIGIAPLAVWERKAVGLRMRTLSLIGSAGCTAEFHMLGFLYENGRSDVSGGLLEQAGRIRWDALMIRDMADNERNNALIASVARRWKAGPVLKEVCPSLKLAEGDDVLAGAGSRTRRSIRSTLRELHADQRIEFREIRDAADAEQAMHTYVQLHKERWKDKGGSIFSDHRQERLLVDEARLAVTSGQGCVHEVVIDHVVAAQLLTLYDGEVGRAYRMSVNTSFLDYNPGHLVVFCAMMDIKKRGLRLLDMGKGAEEFKYRLGAEDRYLIGVHAIRGKMALAKQIADIPGVKLVADRSGLRHRVLKSFYD
jgi:CelD/BcsL family acetyltransferase involved in cellulose biosynthesis